MPDVKKSVDIGSRGQGRDGQKTRTRWTDQGLARDWAPGGGDSICSLKKYFHIFEL